MASKPAEAMDDSWDDTEMTRADYDKTILRILLGTVPTPCGLICRFLAYMTWSFCCPPWPPCIIHKQAFGLRVKSSYEFLPTPKGGYRLILSKDAKRLARYSCRKNPILLTFIQRLIPNLHCFYLPYEKKKRLACVRYRRQKEPWPTILFSKCRFQDIGLAICELASFVRYLNVDVLIYDYAGYGCSDGKLSEERMYRNIERAYEYMTKTLGIPWRQIIAMGASLGTVPTIHLATKFPVGAIVLEGSFMSVNMDKIDKVRCPTLFVHGSKDTMFPVEHMRRLRERCPGAANVDPLIVVGAGHEGFDNRPEYWARLDMFIIGETEVMKGAVSTKLTDLDRLEELLNIVESTDSSASGGTHGSSGSAGQA